MGPRSDRSVSDGVDQHRATVLVLFVRKGPRKVEVIPAYDGILDQPSARLGDFLIFLLALNEFVAVAERNGLGELVRALSFVELFLDRLPIRQIVAIPKNNPRPWPQDSASRTRLAFITNGIARKTPPSTA